MSKTVFRKIHLWLSVPFGLIITVLCLSGAVLVFEEEITQVYREHQHTVSPEPVELPLSVDELSAKLEEAFQEPVTVARVVKSDDPRKAFLFIITSPRRAAVWVDQYTGQIKDSSGKLPFFEAMLNLHRSLMLPLTSGGFNIGSLIVGISALAFIITLFSGMGIWVPKRLIQWRLRFNLFSIHALLGIYAIIFLLIMAVTGLTWTFRWWADIIYAIPGVSRGLITVLHIGTYAGLVTKIIYFISALIGASLPFTGYIMWWKRCCRKGR